MGVYPLSQDQPGQRQFDCEAYSRNAIFPPGITAAMIAADPDVARPQWVVPERFWEDLEKMLAANPKVGKHDAAMADQARTIIALRKSFIQPTFQPAEQNREHGGALAVH
jgi:hypothetical protein